MALRTSDLMMKELSSFLDTLPKKPCDSPPTTRYFCTVCERLNKPVQSRCSQYKSRIEDVGLGAKPSDADFDAEDGEQKDEGSVEFKIVDDKESDDSMPMFEIVKPPAEEAEPLEMSLLEDEAIEFELSDEEEEISEDALEVEPIEEFEASEDSMEVEPMEVEEFEEDEEMEGAGEEKELDFKPLPPEKPKKKHVAKPRTKGKRRKSPVKGKKVKRPTPSTPPRADIPRTKPVTAAPPGRPAGGPPGQVAPPPKPAVDDDATASFIQEIEEQLVLSSNCTLCGAPLSNPKFCTQCGGRVVITAEGVITESRAEPQAKPKPAQPRRGTKKRVVPKKK